MAVYKVALRKESVDRNPPDTGMQEVTNKSLSARRAWIEIETMLPGWTRYASLSARRAWIEIVGDVLCTNPAVIVALRKESVDRNSIGLASFRAYIMVALRKESVDRNLVAPLLAIGSPWSLSARRAWIEIASGWRVSGRTLCRSPQGERG